MNFHPRDRSRKSAVCLVVLFVVGAASKLTTRPAEITLRQLIIDQCALHENNARPVEKFTDVVTVSLAYQAITFQGIDDSNEIFSLVATLYVHWKNPCAQWDDLEQWSNISQFAESLKLTWTPSLQHINGAEDILLHNMAKGSRVHFTKEGYAFWTFTSRYSSSCPMDFKNFPFDLETCTVEIELEDPTNFSRINVDHDSVTVDANFVTPNDIWEYLSLNASVKTVSYVGGEGNEYDRAVFSFKFRRRYQIYVVTIFCPAFGLGILQILTGLLPPDEAERSSFCLTILLAYSVVQSTVDSLLPKSSDIPYFSAFVSTQKIGGFFSSLYALVTCQLARQQTFRQKVKLGCLSCRRIRVVDTVFYLSLAVVSLLLDLAVFYLICT